MNDENLPEKSPEQEAVPKTAILYIEDDPVLRAVQLRFLGSMGAEVCGVSNGQLALQMLEENNGFDAVLSDNSTFGKKGTEVLAVIKDKYPFIYTALISGDELSLEEISQMKLMGVDAYLKKPFNPDDLEAIFKQVQQLKNERANQIPDLKT